MSASSKPERPIGVTLLALLVFVLAVVNLWRVPYSIQHRELLVSLNLPFPLAVHAALGGAWGIAWLVMAWGLWRLKDWARRITPILMAIYQAFRLAWLAVFSRTDYDRGRWPFTIAAAGLMIALTLWITTRPRARRAFDVEKMDETNDN
jgi:hypothetical protein